MFLALSLLLSTLFKNFFLDKFLFVDRKFLDGILFGMEFSLYKSVFLLHLLNLLLCLSVELLTVANQVFTLAIAELFVNFFHQGVRQESLKNVLFLSKLHFRHIEERLRFSFHTSSLDFAGLFLFRNSKVLLESVDLSIKLVLQVSLSCLKLLHCSGVSASADDGFNASASVFKVFP